jgi:hypothetical protein
MSEIGLSGKRKMLMLSHDSNRHTPIVRLQRSFRHQL